MLGGTRGAFERNGYASKGWFGLGKREEVAFTHLEDLAASISVSAEVRPRLPALFCLAYLQARNAVPMRQVAP